MTPMDRVILDIQELLPIDLCFWYPLPKDWYEESEIHDDYVCEEVYVVDVSSGGYGYSLRYHYGNLDQ